MGYKLFVMYIYVPHQETDHQVSCTKAIYKFHEVSQVSGLVITICQRCMQLLKAGVHTPGRSPAARWGNEYLQEYDRLTTPADGRCFFHAVAMACTGYENGKQLLEHQKIATA